jgi:phosphomannomutase/phosphoglucomutase
MSRDGGRTTIELLNILAKSQKSLSNLISTLPKFFQGRDKVEYEWALKDRIISAAKSYFKGERVEELDGLKIWLDKSSWILFRSSANAPEFRVFVESKSENQTKKLLTEGIDLVKQVISEDK